MMYSLIKDAAQSYSIDKIFKEALIRFSKAFLDKRGSPKMTTLFRVLQFYSPSSNLQKTMINTILLEKRPGELDELKLKIEKCCPSLQIYGAAHSAKDIRNLLHVQTPDLAFVNPEIPFYSAFFEDTRMANPNIETIFISNSTDYTLDAIRIQAAGYLSRPLEDDALKATVARVKERIQCLEASKKNSLLIDKLLNERRSNELIGIPTMEGYEFVSANEIIRCEGLQKCTRVVTLAKSDIISSYNIGEFIKLLKPYHFFSPHKSHLVNLAYIKRYLREGVIVLDDKTHIPVSTRRKCKFLEQVVHL